jgi:hypothetical protein
MNKPQRPLATVLPLDARKALAEAAAIPDSKRRAVALDHLIARLRRTHPKFFKH